MTSQIQALKSITDEELVDICDVYTSAQEYLLDNNLPSKGQYSSIINSKRKELNLEWKDKPNKVKNKKCPVCSKGFKPGNKQQVTCSYSCANTHFRSGKNNPNYLGLDKKDYRAICFEYHEKKCVVCGECNIVAVHHYDENHNNNAPTNLIPMCPTHHQYIHSRYKNEVIDIVDNFRNNYIRRLT